METPLKGVKNIAENSVIKHDNRNPEDTVFPLLLRPLLPKPTPYYEARIQMH